MWTILLGEKAGTVSVRKGASKMIVVLESNAETEGYFFDLYRKRYECIPTWGAARNRCAMHIFFECQARTGIEYFLGITG
jgi:hypothetical protein